MNITERRSRRGIRHHALVSLVAAAALLAACGGDDDASSATTTPATTPPATTMPDHEVDHEMDPADRAAAMLATAVAERGEALGRWTAVLGFGGGRVGLLGSGGHGCV